MIIKHGRHILWEIHELRKGMCAFFILPSDSKTNVTKLKLLKNVAARISQGLKSLNWLPVWDIYIADKLDPLPT